MMLPQHYTSRAIKSFITVSAVGIVLVRLTLRILSASQSGKDSYPMESDSNPPDLSLDQILTAMGDAAKVVAKEQATTFARYAVDQVDFTEDLQRNPEEPNAWTMCRITVMSYILTRNAQALKAIPNATDKTLMTLMTECAVLMDDVIHETWEYFNEKYNEWAHTQPDVKAAVERINAATWN